MNLNPKNRLWQWALSTLFFLNSQATQADPAAQYETSCAACHGMSAQGNAEIKAPRLAGQLAIYLETQLLDYQRNLRGYHPKDSSGQSMKAISNKLSKSQVNAIASYLSKLKLKEDTTTATTSLEAKALYQNTCASCHGERGQGSANLVVPNIAILDKEYISEQLEFYDKSWRGSSSKGTARAQAMRSIWAQVNHQNRQTLIDYIASLKAEYK